MVQCRLARFISELLFKLNPSSVVNAAITSCCARYVDQEFKGSTESPEGKCQHYRGLKSQRPWNYCHSLTLCVTM